MEYKKPFIRKTSRRFGTVGRQRKKELRYLVIENHRRRSNFRRAMRSGTLPPDPGFQSSSGESSASSIPDGQSIRSLPSSVANRGYETSTIEEISQEMDTCFSGAERMSEEVSVDGGTTSNDVVADGTEKNVVPDGTVAADSVREETSNGQRVTPAACVKDIIVMSQVVRNGDKGQPRLTDPSPMPPPEFLSVLLKEEFDAKNVKVEFEHESMDEDVKLEAIYDEEVPTDSTDTSSETEESSFPQGSSGKIGANTVKQTGETKPPYVKSIVLPYQSPTGDITPLAVKLTPSTQDPDLTTKTQVFDTNRLAVKPIVTSERTKANDSFDLQNSVALCRLCDVYFPNHECLKDHKMEKHNIIASERSHQDPLKISEKQVVYSCHTCKNIFATEKDLDQHFKGMSCFLECEVCKKTFANKGCLNTHNKVHERETAKSKWYEYHYKKKSISSGDISKRLAENQTKVSHEEHPYTHKYTLQLPETLDNSLHEETSKTENISENIEEERVFTCTFCEEKFPNEDFLVHHVKLHNIPLETKNIEKIPEELVLTCDLCQDTFRNKDFFEHHMKIHEFEIDTRSFDNQSIDNRSIEQVLEDSTGDSALSCTVCQKKFTTTDLLDQHIENHQKETDDTALLDKMTDNVTCKVCQKFGDVKFLDYHLKNHHPEEATQNIKNTFVTCNVCHKVFGGKEYLQHHMKMHPVKKGPKKPKKRCHLCNKIFNRSLFPHHMRYHASQNAAEKLPSSKFMNCKLCSQIFINKHCLDDHIKDSHPIFVCNTCNKICTSTDSLHEHMRTHSQSKPMEIEDSHDKRNEVVFSFNLNEAKTAETEKTENPKNRKESFSFDDLPNDTEITETSEQEFQQSRYERIFEPFLICTVCAKNFETRLDLNRHKKENGHFGCIVKSCPFVLPTMNDLWGHMNEIHTKPVKFPCDLCWKCFDKKGKRNEHRKTHTPGTFCRCKVCNGSGKLVVKLRQKKQR